MITLRLYRISRALKRRGFKTTSNMTKRLCLVLTGADISPDAQLGEIQIAHTAGVVIGAGAVVEDGCLIFSGVVLGVPGLEKPREGWKWQTPMVRGHCILGAGSKIIGPIEIGAHSVIGANAVVTRDVPPHSIVAGIPGRIIRSTQCQSDSVPHGRDRAASVGCTQGKLLHERKTPGGEE